MAMKVRNWYVLIVAKAGKTLIIRRVERKKTGKQISIVPDAVQFLQKTRPSMFGIHVRQEVEATKIDPLISGENRET